MDMEAVPLVEGGNVECSRAFFRRSEVPLAELRQKNALEIAGFKSEIAESVLERGLMIGISPRDDVIDKMSRGEITDLLSIIFKRASERVADGRLVPIATLSLALVGEYSQELHRWHYHGLIYIKDILALDRLKKRIRLKVGRVVTGQVKNFPLYLNYMFKQYDADTNDFYVWNRKECYYRFERLHI